MKDQDEQHQYGKEEHEEQLERIEEKKNYEIVDIVDDLKEKLQKDLHFNRLSWTLCTL